MFASTVLWFLPALFAQAATEPTIPFVGCVSYGQTEKLEAPKGTDRAVSINPTDARKLAYYESADGIGVLAPRGWYCEGGLGSAGAVLSLSPKPINQGPGWKGFDGPAIEVSQIDSETSGRFGVAEIMAQVFPAYRKWAQAVWHDLDRPLPSGPYPTDSLTYRSKSIVEYTTPRHTEGLGTHSTWLRRSDLPITGAAILISDSPGIGDAPDVLLLAVRLPPELASLAPVIVRFVERNTSNIQK